MGYIRINEASRSSRSSRSLACDMDRFWADSAYFRVFYAYFSRMWGILVWFGPIFGVFYAYFSLIWADFGVFWPDLRLFWSILALFGPICGYFGLIWSYFGVFWPRFGLFCGILACILATLRLLWGILAWHGPNQALKPHSMPQMSQFWPEPPKIGLILPKPGLKHPEIGLK